MRREKPHIVVRLGLIVLIVILWTKASAQAPPVIAAVDPLVAIRDADPLSLARVVAQLGDAAVLERLDAASEGTPRPAEIVLAAVRAAPWMRAPEAALGPLMVLALGVDPDLAPAAMLTVEHIVERMDANVLSAHETSLADLTLAVNALETLAGDETARADLRASAALTLTRIRGLSDVSGE